MCNSRHPGPRREWMGGSEQRFWLTNAGGGDAADAPGVFRGPQLLTTLPSNMLTTGAGGPPKVAQNRSSRLWRPRPPPAAPRRPGGGSDLRALAHFRWRGWRGWRVPGTIIIQNKFPQSTCSKWRGSGIDRHPGLCAILSTLIACMSLQAMPVD